MSLMNDFTRNMNRASTQEEFHAQCMVRSYDEQQS